MKKIALHEPFIDSFDIKSVLKSMKTGWVSSAGPLINKFENKIKKITKSKYVIACINGTSAMHIAIKMLRPEVHSEIIVPTITFISSVNAIKYNECKPIFMDVDDECHLDEYKTIEFLKKNTIIKNNQVINKKTKKRISALIIVHLFGGASNFSKIYKFCKKINLPIIEDAAESLGTKYTNGFFKNKHTGTIGNVSIISFNGNKIITTGNGGAILSNSKEISKKARYLINQAKDDNLKHIHNEIGYNYRISNINASLGLSQIKKLNKLIKKKKKIHKFYLEYFKTSKKFKIKNYPKYCKPNYWLNTLLIKNKDYKFADYLIKKNLKKIEFRKIWLPNHLQKSFKNCQKYKLENFKKIYKQSILLPSSPSLKKKDVYSIYNVIKKNYEEFANTK